jgi:hypothetical protein
VENDEVIAFIKVRGVQRQLNTSYSIIQARALLEGQIGGSLTNPMPTGPKGSFPSSLSFSSLDRCRISDSGFNADDGASLLVAFRGLQAESIAQGQVHKAIANDLKTLVADPFDEWAQKYKVYMSRLCYFVICNPVAGES